MKQDSLVYGVTDVFAFAQGFKAWVTLQLLMRKAFCARFVVEASTAIVLASTDLCTNNQAVRQDCMSGCQLNA